MLDAQQKHGTSSMRKGEVCFDFCKHALLESTTSILLLLARRAHEAAEVVRSANLTRSRLGTDKRFSSVFRCLRFNKTDMGIIVHRRLVASWTWDLLSIDVFSCEAAAGKYAVTGH